MTLRAAAIVPPIVVLVAPATPTPNPIWTLVPMGSVPLGSAVVPPGAVPIRLPSIRLPETVLNTGGEAVVSAGSRAIPPTLLAEIRFPAPVAVPPIVLLDDETTMP